jgi:hypothetical protein
VDALYLLQIFNADLLTQPLVQVYLPTAKFKAIAHRTGGLGKHFLQIPLKFH